MTFADFLRTIFKTVNPYAYRDLATRSYKDSQDYFLSILFIIFCISVLLFLPAFASMPKTIEGKIDEFSVLSADIRLQSKEPVLFPEKNPVVIVDTTGTYQNLTKEKALITGDTLYTKAGLCFWTDSLCFLVPKEKRVESVPLTEFSDIVTHKKSISTMITILFLLALPALLISLYLLFAIKYILIILITTGLVFLISRFIMKSKFPYYRLFRVGTYAITLVIILDLLLMPFRINLYFIPVLIYFGLLLVGCYLIKDEDVLEQMVHVGKSKKHEDFSSGSAKSDKKEKHRHFEDSSDYVEWK